jgi:hypothetical protein
LHYEDLNSKNGTLIIFKDKTKKQGKPFIGKKVSNLSEGDIIIFPSGKEGSFKVVIELIFIEVDKPAKEESIQQEAPAESVISRFLKKFKFR